MKEQKKNTRHLWTIAIALAVLGVILGLVLWTRGNSRVTGTANGSPTTTQAGTMTRINEGGQITMKVTWQGRTAGSVFAVEMDTHAVDLDGYDLRQLAVLRTDQGQEIRPGGWNAPMGGHHRSGMLTFPATLADGTPVIGPNTRTLELVIRNVGGIPERMFTWTL
jgi:hypothetical protein